jgi:hypothetical protein
MQLKLAFLLFTLFFKFLGTPEPQTAIILLQNNHEIRATGGFMGSYAKINLKDPQGSDPKRSGSSRGPIGHQAKEGSYPSNIFSLSLQDIYVPDGQIQGHVEPPAPIQQAFGQGWYKLRDANWDPDFPTSAKTIRWFLEKGNEINPDVLIALNLSTIQKLLTLTPPIRVEPVNLTLESSNISLLLQNNIQENFFPGSTNKKDLLTAVNQAFLEKLSSLPLKQKIKIIKIIAHDLKSGEILINSQDPKLQAWLEKKNLAGVLQPTPCTSKVHNCLADTVAIIESNLGSNKANEFITRHTYHQITSESNFITHTITIEYTNSSPSEKPNPPEHHGGDYLNYLRFYIPKNAQNINVSESFSTNKNHGFTEIGFFHTTPHQSTSSITISYQFPITNKSYQLTLLKQPGIENSPQTIVILNSIQDPGKITETNLTHDLTL